MRTIVIATEVFSVIVIVLGRIVMSGRLRRAWASRLPRRVSPGSSGTVCIAGTMFIRLLVRLLGKVARAVIPALFSC